MAMIFPGMDPYLEDPDLWPDVHSALIVYLRELLQPLLRPRYIVGIEQRIYVQGPEREIIPDVSLREHRRPSRSAPTAVAEEDVPVVVRVPLEEEIHESYIAIYDRSSRQRIVTVIEVLSPTNKYAGAGRENYRTKQREILGSQTHLVEIDLLRYGPHALAVPLWAVEKQGAYDYLASINRVKESPRDVFSLYLWTLRQRLPRIRIPLAADEADVPLDLQAVLERTYDSGCYGDHLRYDAPCKPPLAPEDQDWANERIRAAAASPEPPPT